MTLIASLKRFYKEQMFHPNIFSIFFNPFYFTRKGIHKYLAIIAPKLSGKLLDFGCGRKPYENMFNVEKYIGIDIETSGHSHSDSKIDFFYNGTTVPFDDDEFDCVLASEVFEHIFNIDEIIIELQRVLKREGLMIITVPFTWDEHEIPYDFGRYTSFGIRHLIEAKNFTVVDQYKAGTYIETLTQLKMNYNYLNLLPKNPTWKLLLNPLINGPVALFGKVKNAIFPKSQSLYLTNVLLVKNMK